MDMNEPFGPACSSVPKDGAGSFTGMAKDLVATAASHNPALSTLATAVKKAGLVDTLNNAQKSRGGSEAGAAAAGPGQLRHAGQERADEAYTVNDTSKVVCGNVPTANATVYIVDTVLMPPQ
jgi:uncharacterized surface protein with fasciclin (FAS1) repeats